MEVKKLKKRAPNQFNNWKTYPIQTNKLQTNKVDNCKTEKQLARKFFFIMTSYILVQLNVIFLLFDYIRN